jgi:hypothetical protein
VQLLTEQTVAIYCNVETAFAYVANMENFGKWFPEVRSIVSANALPHAVKGKEYLETFVSSKGKERQIRLRVQEVDANTLFLTEGEYSPLLPRMEVTFASQGDHACTVTWRMYSRNNGVIARFTLLPLVRRVIRKRAVIGMARLKEKLESKDAK